MKKISRFLALSTGVLLVGCSSIPSEFSSPKQNQVSLPALQNKNYHELFWEKSPIYLTFKTENGYVTGLNAVKQKPTPPQDKTAFYCLHLDNKSKVSVCEKFDRKIYSPRNWNVHNIIMAPVSLAFTPILVWDESGRELLGDGFLGERKFDPKIPAKVADVLLNNIAAEYETARKTPNELLKFFEKYHVTPKANSIFFQDLAKTYNSASPSVQQKIEPFFVTPAFFSINGSTPNAKSGFDTQSLNLGFTAFTGTGRTISQWVNITLNRSVIPFKYNTYKVKLKATYQETMDASVRILGMGLSTTRHSDRVITKDVILSPSNNYQNDVKIEYEIASSIDVNAGIGGMSGNVTDIKPKSFEIIGVEVVK